MPRTNTDEQQRQQQQQQQQDGVAVIKQLSEYDSLHTVATATPYDNTQPAGDSGNQVYTRPRPHSVNTTCATLLSCIQSTCLTATATHMPYRITQCYLPPDRSDISAFTPAEAGTRLSDPGGMQG